MKGDRPDYELRKPRKGDDYSIARQAVQETIEASKSASEEDRKAAVHFAADVYLGNVRRV